MTLLSGRGTAGQKNMNLETVEYTKSKYIKKMASIMSIPVIDANSECGINRFNRTSCIQDDVHPYYQGG